MSNLIKHGWTRPTTILVATDLADTDRLFPVALNRALESDSRLILLHILTAGNTIAIDSSGLPFYDPIEALRFAEKSLDVYRMQAHDAGLSCSIMVREGVAAQQIVATARQLNVDLLVLGTRSRSRLGKMLLGSVADQVLRSVPVPVLTVGPEAHLRATVKERRRTVLYATTLSESSHKSATLACELARSSNARLVMIHVLPPPFSFGRMEASDLRECTLRELERLIPQDLSCTCSAEAQVAVGNPAIEILAEAANQDADIIVLGASQQSTLQKLAKDGTIYRILAHSRCPVLTILEDEEASETAMPDRRIARSGIAGA